MSAALGVISSSFTTDIVGGYNAIFICPHLLSNVVLAFFAQLHPLFASLTLSHV